MSLSKPRPQSGRFSVRRSFGGALGILVVSLGMAVPGLGQGEPSQGSLNDRLRAEEQATAWRDEVLRAERTSFPRRAGSLALRVVERRTATSREMAAALWTLGASGLISEASRLESFALEGLPLERRAAVLALGELGSFDPVAGSDRLLERLLDDPDAELAACALLGLLRTGQPEWRTRARQLSASSGERLAREADLLLDFVSNPLTSAPTAAADVLLEIRWDAARRYGLVDGRSYSEVLKAQLSADKEFIDALVLQPAAQLGDPAIKDHLLGILVGGEGTTRLRAVVQGMAPELEKILAADLWQPKNDLEWRVLVDEVLEANLERFLPTLFSLALAEPSTAPLAAGMLGREDPIYVDVLVGALSSEDPEQRLLGCHGFVILGDTTQLVPLRRLAEDDDLRVRAAALAARVRLRDPDARSLASILVSSEAPRERDVEAERRELIDALVRFYRFPHVTEFLEAHRGVFAPEEIGGPLACLFLRGRQTDSRLLFEAFEYLEPNSISALRVAQALERSPTSEDVEFIAERFPVEGQAELNAIFARILLGVAHPQVMPLVEAAVWRKDWDRSLLASAVALDAGGMRTLLGWIDSPPNDADSEDIRRLGFAIGQWRGSEGLEELRSHLRINTGEANHPELQGALLGYLVSRTH